MDFYARRSPFSPVLGLEEGETRKACPPGTVKSYLPQFPWSECIPADQALKPRSMPTSIPRPGPTATTVTAQRPGTSAIPPVPPPPPPLPPVAPLPPVPRKARFLSVDQATGAVMDPDTGAIIESASVYSIDTVDTVAIGVGLGLVAVLLTLAGVFD